MVATQSCHLTINRDYTHWPSRLALTGGDAELALKACAETTRRGDVDPQ
jgi:hypothetical protein